MKASDLHSFSRKKYSAIIVGGGHNGLVNAAYLAREGLRVLVLERHTEVGGAAVTEEFHPGFRNSVASYTVSLLSPKVIAELDLPRHGLRIVERPVSNFWPIDDRRSLLMPAGKSGRYTAIAGFSQADAERLEAFETMLETAADVLRGLIHALPPRLTGTGSGTDFVKVIRQSRRFMALTSDAKRDVLDLFLKSAAEILDRWFENTHVKAAFAFDSIVGAYASPTTPGTGYVLLHHLFGEVNGNRGAWGHAIGGMGAISKAIAGAAEAAGAEIVTGADVARILVSENCAVGVALSDGRTAHAPIISAGVAPKLLFRDLIEPAAVPETLRRRFTGLRSGSGTFRMNVALRELPDFRCRPGRDPAPHHGAGIIIGPTMDYLEAAYIDARQEGTARQPIVEMLIPSTLDDTLAPPGQHVASLFVQHVAPHLPHPRTWDDPSEKEAFADRVIATVNTHAPNFAASVIARQVLSPKDLETRFGLVDGDIFHGQLGLDQLFAFRPVLGYADYEMPIKGLYLCGSGGHPGGGVTGAPGRNAAMKILSDTRTRRLKRKMMRAFSHGPKA